MSDFFNLSIPASNKGFGMFSAGHIAWLIIGLIFCILVCRLYRHSSNRCALRFVIAGAALFFELLRAVLMALAGEYSIYTLPLHLCGMAVYLNAAHAVTGSKNLGQFLYAFCFPGAVFAIVFPDWNYFPLFNILTVIAFVLHILIVCYIVMQADDIQPSIRFAPSNLIIMLALAVPVYIIDRLISANYMFMNWPVMPLTLFEFLERPWYVLGYIPIIAATWLIIYLPFFLKRRRLKNDLKKQDN